MNKENIPVITDREELYDKCENMKQLFDKYYLPLLDKHYSKVYELQQENNQLKEQLEASEKLRKEAIEFINDKSDKGYNFGWILQNEEIYKLLEILYVDKGE